MIAFLYIWIYLKYSPQNMSLGSCGGKRSEALRCVHCYCWFSAGDTKSLQLSLPRDSIVDPEFTASKTNTLKLDTYFGLQEVPGGRSGSRTPVFLPQVMSLPILFAALSSKQESFHVCAIEFRPLFCICSQSSIPSCCAN